MSSAVTFGNMARWFHNGNSRRCPLVPSEQTIQQQIRQALGNGLTRLFRNNTGRLRDERGQLVTFGLCPGSSDLIGYTSVTICPEHVGQTLAVFCAVEVKSATGRITPQQQAFITHITAAGGRAGIARSVEEAQSIVRGNIGTQAIQFRNDSKTTAPRNCQH